MDADPAAQTINRNKGRILEHLVQVLSEWIVASIKIDLRQALTIDRESSRDRAPIGLVRCICKDDQVKGKHAYVKFKLSNIHAFVPVWMAPIMLKNFCLIAAQSLPLSPLGQLDYREGSPRDVIGFCFAEDQVNLNQRPLFRKVGKDSKDFITKRAWGWTPFCVGSVALSSCWSSGRAGGAATEGGSGCEGAEGGLSDGVCVKG